MKQVPFVKLWSLNLSIAWLKLQQKLKEMIKDIGLFLVEVLGCVNFTYAYSFKRKYVYQVVHTEVNSTLILRTNYTN